jgi:hypothetical protein
MIVKPKFEPDYFWKNFRLGSELQISGAFIYNGLFTLENMETFYYEEECFEFLYNMSIGIERLEKVAIVLVEHNSSLSQDQFEKSLITHNHVELLNRIKKKKTITVGKPHMKFLDMLATFYKSTRYDRFNFSSVYHPPLDQQRLIEFISNELKMEIKIGLPFSTGVSDRIKTFIGKIVGKIVSPLFEIIEAEATRLHMYTYELPYNSKAFKVFKVKEFDFTKEKLMQREVFLYTLKKLPNDELKKFVNKIHALPFGQMHSNKYLHSIMNFHVDRSVIDEMEYLYEERKIPSSRIKEVMLLGSSTNFEAIKELDELFGPITHKNSSKRSKKNQAKDRKK